MHRQRNGGFPHHAAFWTLLALNSCKQKAWNNSWVPTVKQDGHQELCELWGIPSTAQGKRTSSLILTLSHCPLTSSETSLSLPHMESYLTSRTSGRVEWSRMIREERFCGESAISPRGDQRCGVAGQGFPPAQGMGSQLPGMVLERQVIALERREPLACSGQRDSACPVLKALVPAAL